MINLHQLDLYNNQINHITGINKLINLRSLYLHNNKIINITGINKLINLQYLYLQKNKITNISLFILHNINLIHLYYDANIILDPIIERFLNRNQIKNNKTIYNDTQNVHNNNINKSISDSLYRIMIPTNNIDFQNLYNDILNDDILDKFCKESLIEYSKQNDVHSILNVTFSETLYFVWNIIKLHNNRNDILNILNDEMKDSLCKCFTGRLSRLINCLNGFDDRVNIMI